MLKQNILSCNASSFFRKNMYGQLNYRIACTLPILHDHPNHVIFCHLRDKMQSVTLSASLDSLEISPTLQRRCIKGAADENQGELSEEDDDICPVDCVREFKTDEEFLKILEKAKDTNCLVVVDFYRTSCGSCKYIEQGFSKLCKGAGDEDADVIFLKHNVVDEYDEQSEVAERLRIRAVPLFHFYKNGVLLEAFPTRDKERIVEAIKKYTSTNEDA
ncbi:Thioredoxin-like 4 [Hibiscus syriacus]|uniref:Thioredoxin-like 4, chloroplastic n=1 Tax=Hibiscus syriacus TaxID=106335 RepID=A0A6A3BQJ7_HIBSY|nr:thioredoxin-like 4, chloroplastic [Hibiscus syriacus]KAE8718131.1 Thioredoxin-like 4 [Hibiscus syriacus]